MSNDCVIDNLRLRYSNVVVATTISDGFHEVIPDARILDSELKHEVVGPFPDIVVLKTKFRVAELAINIAAPCFFQVESDLSIKAFRFFEVFCRNVGY